MVNGNIILIMGKYVQKVIIKYQNTITLSGPNLKKMVSGNIINMMDLSLELSSGKMATQSQMELF